MIDPAIKAAWHAGFESGFMVACLLILVGWMWKKWCERIPK